MVDMYQSVSVYDQLDVMEKELEALVKGENIPRLVAKLKRIVNRRM